MNADEEKAALIGALNADFHRMSRVGSDVELSTGDVITTVEESSLGVRRWNMHVAYVGRSTSGRFWMWSYDRGLTENQEDSFDSDHNVKEVWPKKVVRESTEWHSQPTVEKPSLASIVARFLDAMEESGGETVDAVEEAAALYADKIEAYRSIVPVIEAQAKSLKDQAALLRERSDRLYSKIDSLRERVVDSMYAVGTRKVSTSFGNVTLVQSKSVQVGDAWAITMHDSHPEFVRVSYAPDKTALKERWLAETKRLVESGLSKAQAEAHAITALPPGVDIVTKESIRGL